MKHERTEKALSPGIGCPNGAGVGNPSPHIRHSFAVPPSPQGEGLKRRVWAVLLILCLLLSGCHGKRDIAVFEIPEAFDTSRNYEISFWAKNDNNQNQVQIYNQAIADFEALYPNIKVTLRRYTNYGNIYNDVITNIATDTTPNVCITYPDHIATYMTGEDTVVPLDDLLSHPRYGLGGSEVRFDSPTKEEIVPQFLQEGIVAGQQYALPFMRSTEACYINKDFVEKLGYTVPEVLTWDFIWEVSEAAAQKDESGIYKLNGQKTMIPFIYKSTDNMMIQMLYQQNAGYATADGELQIFNDTTKELLYTVAEHTKSGAFSTFKISGYPANFLNAGQCVFAIDSTAGATWMGSDAPLIDIAEDKLVQFETVVKPIPQYDPENPQMISQGPSLCVFNKEDPQEVLASWLFAQFLLTNKVQIAYSQTEGYLPVTTKAQESEEYRDYLARCGEDNDKYYDIKIQASQLLMDNIENTFTTPVFNGSASLRDAAGQLVENVSLSVQRKQTVDEKYMEALQADVTALCRLDQLQGLGGKAVLGELPAGSATLLWTLAGVWACIIAYVVFTKLKSKKQEKHH